MVSIEFLRIYLKVFIYTMNVLSMYSAFRLAQCTYYRYKSRRSTDYSHTHNSFPMRTTGSDNTEILYRSSSIGPTTGRKIVDLEPIVGKSNLEKRFNAEAFYNHSCEAQKQGVKEKEQGVSKKSNESDKYKKLYFDEDDSKESESMLNIINDKDEEKDRIMSAAFILINKKLNPVDKELLTEMGEQWLREGIILKKKAWYIIKKCKELMDTNECDCDYVYNVMLMRILMCVNPMLEMMTRFDIYQDIFTIYVICRILLHNQKKDCNQFQLIYEDSPVMKDISGLKYVCIHTNIPLHFTFGIIDPNNCSARLFQAFPDRLQQIEDAQQIEDKSKREKTIKEIEQLMQEESSKETQAEAFLRQKCPAIRDVKIIKILQWDSQNCGLIVIHLMNEDLKTEGKLESEDYAYKFYIESHFRIPELHGFPNPREKGYEDIGEPITKLKDSLIKKRAFESESHEF